MDHEVISLNDHNSENDHDVQMLNVNQPKRRRPKGSTRYTLKRNPRRKVYFDQSVIGSGEHESKLESIDINASDEQVKGGDHPEKGATRSTESRAGSENNVADFNFSNLIRENRNGQAEKLPKNELSLNQGAEAGGGMLTGKLVENVSDEEEALRSDRTRGEGCSGRAKASEESRAGEGGLVEKNREEVFDKKQHDELMDENIEFSKEKNLIEFVFNLLEEARKEAVGQESSNQIAKKNETISEKDPVSGEPRLAEKISEMRILDENEQDKAHKKNTEELDFKTSKAAEAKTLNQDEKEGLNPLSKELENKATNSEAKNDCKPANETNAKDKIEPSTTDEAVTSETSKLGTSTGTFPKSDFSELDTNLLQKILSDQSEKFKDSVLNYMILNPEPRADHKGQNAKSIISRLTWYDQYLLNDNMEFLSVVLSLLHAHRGAESLGDPVVRVVLRLLVKRLLNTTDNYIQCEKSYSMIVSKFTKNVRERFNDLKSYLLNQKLKNMSDLKIKTSSLVKKMNMTLDSVGGKNSLVASAINRRHDQIEGFVGNYIEREGYSQLNMAKILKEPKIDEVPQLKGRSP